jgi:hypothetical protein
MNKNKGLKILFIGKDNDTNSREAANFIALHFANLQLFPENGEMIFRKKLKSGRVI